MRRASASIGVFRVDVLTKGLLGGSKSNAKTTLLSMCTGPDRLSSKTAENLMLGARTSRPQLRVRRCWERRHLVCIIRMQGWKIALPAHTFALIADEDVRAPSKVRCSL